MKAELASNRYDWKPDPEVEEVAELVARRNRWQQKARERLEDDEEYEEAQEQLEAKQEEDRSCQREEQKIPPRNPLPKSVLLDARHEAVTWWMTAKKKGRGEFPKSRNRSAPPSSIRHEPIQAILTDAKTENELWLYSVHCILVPRPGSSSMRPLPTLHSIPPCHNTSECHWWQLIPAGIVF